jgi:ribosomal protein S18 acetylase RimI-like enzyme
MKITGPALQQAELCERILRSLPEWFGIESAIQQFLVDIENLPTLIARQDEQAVGFLTIKQHFNHTAEVYVTGILPEYHRQGIGSQLMAEAENYLRTIGVEYLQVKTLGPSHSDPFYACTRAFYQKHGFRPLEEFKQIWDEDNPCLILIKRL